MGWKTDPTFIIRPDPNGEATYPFPHSPTSSHQPEEKHMSYTEGQSPTTLGDSPWPGINPTKPPSTEGHTTIDNHTTPHGEPTQTGPELMPTDVPPTSTSLSFLTINAQKAGINSPSLSDIVTMLDDHAPNISLSQRPRYTRVMGP